MRNRSLLLIVLGLLASSCNRLATLPYLPETTPEMWLKNHPHLNISLGFIDFTLMEPSSVFFVYLLGIVAILVGAHFLKTKTDQNSRRWWGIALVLWGVQAFLGGTHYQSLSYELRCAGREICANSSWVEIYYYLVSILSINAMVLAVSYSSSRGTPKKLLTVYAISNTIVYSSLCLFGAFLPSRFLVSFELIVLFTTPSYLILFIINCIRYFQQREKMDLLLMFTWLGLGLVMAAYYLFLGMGWSKTLWEQGIWFNANDVLHIGLILWMFYIAFFVSGRVKDHQ